MFFFGGIGGVHKQIVAIELFFKNVSMSLAFSDFYAEKEYLIYGL